MLTETRLGCRRPVCLWELCNEDEAMMFGTVENVDCEAAEAQDSATCFFKKYILCDLGFW